MTKYDDLVRLAERLRDWKWLAEYANGGWDMPPGAAEALRRLCGKAAAALESLRFEVESLTDQIAKTMQELLAAEARAAEAEGFMSLPPTPKQAPAAPQPRELSDAEETAIYRALPLDDELGFVYTPRQRIGLAIRAGYAAAQHQGKKKP